MQSWAGYTGLDERARGCVIALGNFDGVHAGHARVVEQAGALAQQLDAPLGVALFEPHPRRFFAPDAPPFRLMSRERRNRRLDALGVQSVFELPFDRAMSQMTPEAFVRDVLVEGLGIRGVVTGADFHFGNKRAGSTDDLAAFGEALGFATGFAELLDNGVDKVSSTRIRKCLSDGDVAAASSLLGQPWVIDGEVLHGDKRGRTIGFPTANIDLGDFTRPALGVYAVRVGLEGEAPNRPAVANFGNRPTVDGLTERLEVHLFDFDGDLYGQTLAVSFAAFLRPEKAFAGIDALKAQIIADAEQARALLRGAAGPV